MDELLVKSLMDGTTERAVVEMADMLIREPCLMSIEPIHEGMKLGEWVINVNKIGDGV